jgi:hypothetical protein
MITNNKALYQLINNKGDIEIAVKINIFQNYQSFGL